MKFDGWFGFPTFPIIIPTFVKWLPLSPSIVNIRREIGILNCSREFFSRQMITSLMLERNNTFVTPQIKKLSA